MEKHVLTISIGNEQKEGTMCQICYKGCHPYCFGSWCSPMFNDINWMRLISEISLGRITTRFEVFIIMRNK